MLAMLLKLINNFKSKSLVFSNSLNMLIQKNPEIMFSLSLTKIHVFKTVILCGSDQNFHIYLKFEFYYKIINFGLQ